MTSRNIGLALILTVSLVMLAFQAVASEQKEPGANRNYAAEAEVRSGVINRIDIENSRLVIDDLKFSFIPQQLIVRKGGHVSSLKALRPNQRVRYSNNSRLPGGSGNRAGRIIYEIWIEK